MMKAVIKEQKYKDSHSVSAILVNNNGDEITLHPDVKQKITQMVYEYETLHINQIVEFEDLGGGVVKLRILD